MNKKTFGSCINTWLDEPDGEQFTDGKWRFWLPAVLGFSVLNAVLTVMIFRETDSANYLTPALLAASAIVSWIAIGCLHYSDAKRGKMAQGVSALDSATLLFVIGHFCFLVYILGHSWILRGADADYKTAVEKHNATAQEMSTSNEKITEALRQAEASRKETAKIEADTAYQYRQAAKHGAKINTQRAGGITANIELAKVELAPPPEKPTDTQAAFLTRWDAWVRITNFGELILAAITLIFIRNWTAKTNSPSPRIVHVEEFPREIETETRAPIKHERLETAPTKSQRKKKLERTIDSFDSKQHAAGAKALRDALKIVSFRLKGYSFKVTVKPDCVWIMMVEANQGTQQTVASARCDLAILRDAEVMPSDKFCAKLELTLKRGGFEI